MKLAALLAAVLVALAGFGVAGCSDGSNRSITNSPGVNPKPVSPTTGTIGTQAPTPTPTTTAG